MDKKSTNNTIQTFWVIIGSLSAISFSIVSSMILSRYFNKEDYGTYKQVMYVYNTLLVVFTLGLPKAFSYFLPRINNNQAKDLIGKLNNILLSMGAIMSLCLFIGSEFIADLLKNDNLILPIKYFALVPFFLLPTLGLEGILATYKKTLFLAIYKTSTQVFTLLCVVLPVIYFKGNIETAIIGFTISSFLCFVLAIYLKFYPIKNYKREKSKITYKDIFKYTIPIMGASIWGIIISSADQFFISRYFGNKVFADFANGSLELPIVSMIISSTSTILSPAYSRLAYDNTESAKETLITLWTSVFEKTVKIIYPLVIFCFFFADLIMELIYGNKYVESGIYFQIKLIVNLFTIITYGPLILSIGGQKFYYNVHMYGALVLIFLEYISVKTINSPYIITCISVFCQISRIIIMLAFVANYLQIKIFELFPLKLIINISIPSVVIIFFLKYFIIQNLNVTNLFLILISLCSYLLIYFYWCYLRKIDYKSIIDPLLRKFYK